MIADSPVHPDYVVDASGFQGWADRAFTPVSVSDVREIFGDARASRTPVTLLGAGSGLTGGRVAQGGWVVSLENFKRLEIGSGLARAGAAVRLFELNLEAARSNQFYAPDPTENTASLGGTIATNASGSRSFRYGSTRKHILALQVVTMDGEVHEYRRGDAIDFQVPALSLPRSRKCTAGFPLRPGMDWIDLFCGSEGTLGAVLEAEVRLLPLPEELFAAVVFFPDDDSALDAVDDWRSVNRLRMLEYFDRGSLDLLTARYPEIPKPAGAALLIESEGDDLENWERRLVRAKALIGSSWFAVSVADRERFRKFRHALPERVNATMADRGFLKMGSDYAVPLEENRRMLRYYRDRLQIELPGRFVMYGHIGDAHVHVNLLPASEEEMATAYRMMDEFAAKAAELGGTVSAEHGLGKRKAAYLKLQYGPAEIEAMAAVKRHLDPNWLLGRGTLLPVPSEFQSL